MFGKGTRKDVPRSYVYYHGMNIVFHLVILGDEKTHKYPGVIGLMTGAHVGIGVWNLDQLSLEP